MLPARHRLRDALDFRSVLRGPGAVRCGGALIVVHGCATLDPQTGLARPARLGLIVPSSVGTAVTRNLISRRLRHLVRDRIDTVPSGTDLVIRALPSAASARYADLQAEVERLLSKTLNRLQAQPSPSRSR